MTDERIAEILFIKDVDAVTASWGAVSSALEEAKVLTDLTAVAALATMRVECGPRFLPIREIGDATYFLTHYWMNKHVRAMLGNTESNDAIKFSGRGFIQLTGRSNYQRYGTKLGIDLINNPDEALVPGTAAKIFVDYFVEHKIPGAAEAKQWELVRRKVNGGLNGYDDFKKHVERLCNEIPNV